MISVLAVFPTDYYVLVDAIHNVLKMEKLIQLTFAYHKPISINVREQEIYVIKDIILKNYRINVNPVFILVMRVQDISMTNVQNVKLIDYILKPTKKIQDIVIV